MIRYLAAAALAFAATASTASAQQCLHGSSETPEHRVRREQALKMAVQNRLDPCHYAVFSDEDKRIYEAVPTDRVLVVPATGN
jgi:hypothetical protein